MTQLRIRGLFVVLLTLGLLGGCGRDDGASGPVLLRFRVAVQQEDVAAFRSVVRDLRSTNSVETEVLASLAESLRTELLTNSQWPLDRPPSEEALLACGNQAIPWLIHGYESWLADTVTFEANIGRKQWWQDGLWEQFGSSAQAALIEILKDEENPEAIKFGAADAVGALRCDLEVSTVSSLLDRACSLTESTRVQFACLGVLARSGCGSLPGLGVALASPDRGIRICTTRVLGALDCQEEEVESALKRLLEDRDAAVRAHAAVSILHRASDACGDTRRKQMQLVVQEALVHSDPSIRLEGLRAVARWPCDPNWVKATCERLAAEDPSETVRAEAQRRRENTLFPEPDGG